MKLISAIHMPGALIEINTRVDLSCPEGFHLCDTVGFTHPTHLPILASSLDQQGLSLVDS